MDVLDGEGVAKKVGEEDGVLDGVAGGAPCAVGEPLVVGVVERVAEGERVRVGKVDGVLEEEGVADGKVITRMRLLKRSATYMAPLASMATP